MRTLLQDLVYSFRQMWKSPGFTATAIGSLALGIGATTAVFSVIHAVLVNPYPYTGADRMVHLVVKDKAGNDRWIPMTISEFQQLRQAKCVESAIMADDWNLTTTDEDLPDDVSAVYLTSNASTHFGVPALLGRMLIESDGPEGQDVQPVVVLSYKFWQRHFNGDPGVVGRTLQLVHKTYTIVGVAPPRFTWLDGEVYIPLKRVQDPGKRFFVFIRLRPGVSRAAADAEFQPLLEQFAKAAPNRFPDKFHVHILGLNEWTEKHLGGTLYLLFGAVGLLLAIGCANVSILVLARGIARHHELAIRAAMGASRGRMLRQLMTESLALAVPGALAGVLLARQMLIFIVNRLPEYSFPHEATIRINVPVLLFSIALALITGVLAGLSPAMQLSRPELGPIIQGGSSRLTGGVRGRRTHSVLVAGQIALTMVLLTGAGAAIEGFLRMMHTDLGYDPHNTMSVGIPVHDNTYVKWEDRAQFFENMRRRIAALPGVAGAGISTNATPPSNGNDSWMEMQGGAIEQKSVRANFISSEYFTVLHIPLLEGRAWTNAETIRGAPLAIINQTAARQFWPKGNVLGQQIRFPQLTNDPPYSPAAPGSDGWLQIIGVVADARDDGLRKPVKPAVYVPYALRMRVFTQILVRTRGNPLALLKAVREQVHAVDADQQIMGHVRNLEEWITGQIEYGQERLVATLFSGFAVLALLLSSFGLYSVVSYVVAQRTNEIGIRMALGAERSHVLRLVFASTAACLAGGVAVGIGMSVALNAIVEQWAGASSRDPLLMTGVIALLVLAATAACVLPARKASGLDPMIALRYE
jgi:putative ABC transport system permease protein